MRTPVVATFGATFWRQLVTNVRAYLWSSLLDSVVSTSFLLIIALLMYHKLFAGHTNASFRLYTGTADYVAFILVGILLYPYLQSTLLGVGRALLFERFEGTLEALYLTPMSSLGYQLGILGQQLLLTTTQTAGVLLIAALFGIRFTNANLVAFTLLVPLVIAGLLGMALLLACLILWLRDSYIVQNTAIHGLLLISGLFFPIQYLPPWVQVVSQALPLTHSVTLLRRALLNGTHPQGMAMEILVLALLSGAYVALGLGVLSALRRQALEGTLS